MLSSVLCPTSPMNDTEQKERDFLHVTVLAAVSVAVDVGSYGGFVAVLHPQK